MNEVTEDDKKAYLKGREVGIPRYCTRQNGFSEGKSGDYYRNVCPPDLDPAFLRGYKLGDPPLHPPKGEGARQAGG